MSVDRGGEAKETLRTDGAATGGNWESAPHPSGVVSVGYPVRAGGRVEGDRGAVGSTAPPFPPPAPCIGDRTEIHLFSCHDYEQHQRATVGGCIVAALDDGQGWLVRLDRPVEEYGGQLVEGPSWPRPGACPNAVPAVPVSREAAA